MCNAWNHPSGCTCGWGGDGHAGSGGSGGGYHVSMPLQITPEIFFINYWSKNRLSQYESYINPNAKCPVCGATVFFCQLSNGGRVYFDDLGPPWPKHPCTDNFYSFSNSRYSTIYPQAYSDDRPAIKKQPDWQKDGWDPVVMIEFLRYDTNKKLSILKFERVENRDVIAIGVNAIFAFKINLPIFIREKDVIGLFDISCLFDEENSQSVECRYYTGYSHVHEIEDFDRWKRSIDGNGDDKNLLALHILFHPNGVKKDSVLLSDISVDWAAVEYWFDQSMQEGSRLGLVNLKRLKDARKHKTGMISVSNFLFS